MLHAVVPAKAGARFFFLMLSRKNPEESKIKSWIPAFAGMTSRNYFGRMIASRIAASRAVSSKLMRPPVWRMPRSA